MAAGSTAMRNGKAIAANVTGNICRNGVLKLSACFTRRPRIRKIPLSRASSRVTPFPPSASCSKFLVAYFYRDGVSRSTGAGSHRGCEEKKVQQEKKYKLLNISFRKPVAKGKLCYVLTNDFPVKGVKWCMFACSSSGISGIVSRIAEGQSRS